jgi:hypothetical protein
MRAAALSFTIALCAQAAHAGGEIDGVRRANEELGNRLDTCAIIVRTIFVKIRGQLPMEKDDDPKGCAADGKAALRQSFDKLKAAFGKKGPPQALTDWRLEWMAAFDSSIPSDGDTERAYLQRQSESKANISRATNKLEIALE